MKVFTYRDYIKCIHALKLSNVMQVAEDEEEYYLKNRNVKNIHDKLMKNILKDRREMANFINKFIEPKEKVYSKDLRKYTNSYISKKYRYKEADIVYKLEQSNTFFLVEHQSRVDNKMSLRIVNYCVDIIYEWSRSNRITKDTSYPIVVPIVLYTGTDKWNLTNNFDEQQEENYTYEDYKIRAKYNLIDINRIPIKTLLEKRSLLGYALILEKSKNEEELLQNASLILRSTNDFEMLQEVKEMFILLLRNSMENGLEQEMIEKFDLKIKMERNDTMSTLVERLTEEYRKEIRAELRKGKKEFLSGFILNKVPDEIIIKSGNGRIDQKELDEFKKEIFEEERQKRAKKQKELGGKKNVPTN